MALEMDREWPEKRLRGWAKAYRETPEYRFPSDPSAEFFPVDMEAAADEIERLRAENLELAKHIDGCVRVAADALKRAEMAEGLLASGQRSG